MILGFYANDFEDNIKSGLFGLDEDGSLTIRKSSTFPALEFRTSSTACHSSPGLATIRISILFFNGVWEFFKAKLANDAAAAVAEYAIPTTNNSSSYEIELTAALLTRMYRFCQDRDIKLIVVDIPRIPAHSSLPPSIQDKVSDSNVARIDGASLMRDYAGIAEIHLPHGHRHISEFAHVMLGVAAAKQIEAWTPPYSAAARGLPKRFRPSLSRMQSSSQRRHQRSCHQGSGA